MQARLARMALIKRDFIIQIGGLGFNLRRRWPGVTEWIIRWLLYFNSVEIIHAAIAVFRFCTLNGI